MTNSTTSTMNATHTWKNIATMSGENNTGIKTVTGSAVTVFIFTYQKYPHDCLYRQGSR